MGIFIESTIGAKRNLKVYGIEINEKNPIVAKLKPCSKRVIFNVDNISARGKPLEIPKKKIITKFFADFVSNISFVVE